jgi:hypothetical protein
VLKIEDSEMAETAREDLDRIFNTGGVAASVGNTYGAAKDVGVYVTGEAIRGLAAVAYGRKPADTDQAAFQGIHALHPFVLVDEACGVPKSIFDAVDSLATNENAECLPLGTQTTLPVTSRRSANPGRDGT